jgi:hypothetical protein
MLSRGWNEQQNNLIVREFQKLPTQKYLVALKRFYRELK